MSSNPDLPTDVLLHIFCYYLETETQRDLIYNVSHVCRKWRKVCMDKSLWRVFDGTVPLCMLENLCEQGCLDETEKFTFSLVKEPISREELQNICRSLPGLKSINFSGVISELANQKCQFFIDLIDLCPDLSEIILTKNCSKLYPCIDCKPLGTFLQNRGSKFISLEFSNTKMVGMSELFTTIASSCPNLEELKVRNLDNTAEVHFPIDSMQIGLKKLKVLELEKDVTMENETEEIKDGFPNLLSFTYAGSRNHCLKKLNFEKVLMKSPNLKELNITGSTRISYVNLFNLPAVSLEKLFVSNTKLLENVGFDKVVKKWGHCLVALDVSTMNRQSINDMFSSLISDGCLKNLEFLNLRGTKVTASTVEIIAEKCTKLNFLDLSSAGLISVDKRRKYRGQTEISKLLKPSADDDWGVWG